MLLLNCVIYDGVSQECIQGGDINIPLLVGEYYKEMT